MTPDRKKLLRLFDDIGVNEQNTLLAFAEFLHSRVCEARKVPNTPQAIPRPPTESVVGAIKRLTATYPMLDQARLLNETSALMTSHLMEGRLAKDVVDDLEGLFARHFEQWCNEQNVEAPKK